MIASIRDKEAWILEKEEDIAEGVYRLAFADLPEEIQAAVHRLAYFDYVDTISAYAESRCSDKTHKEEKYARFEV